MGIAKKQGELWNSSAKNWSEIQEPLHQPLWNAIFDEVNLNKESIFLDAGCGGGGACLLAEKRGAKITGIEAASSMVDFAKKQVQSGDFSVGDIQYLPYDDNIFDVVLASSSIQYTEDKIATLKEFKRVIKNDGRIIVSNWSEPKKVEYRIIFDVLKNMLPPNTKNKGPFELSHEGVLENLMKDANIIPIVTKDVHTPFKYKNFEDFWKVNLSTGPFQMALKFLDEKKLKNNIFNAIENKISVDGTMLIDNYYKYVVGK